MLSINVNIGLFVYAILLRDMTDFLQFLQKVIHLLLKVCVLLRKSGNRAFYFKLKGLSTNDDKIIPQLVFSFVHTKHF